MASPSASIIDGTIKLPQIAPQDPFVKVVKALAAYERVCQIFYSIG